VIVISSLGFVSSPRKKDSFLTCECSSRLHLQGMLGVLFSTNSRQLCDPYGAGDQVQRTSEASSTAECAPSDNVTRTESSFDELFDRSYTSKLPEKGIRHELGAGRKVKGGKMQTHET
jgi:hypothetical protein